MIIKTNKLNKNKTFLLVLVGFPNIRVLKCMKHMERIYEPTFRHCIKHVCVYIAEKA